MASVLFSVAHWSVRAHISYIGPSWSPQKETIYKIHIQRVLIICRSKPTVNLSVISVTIPERMPSCPPPPVVFLLICSFPSCPPHMPPTHGPLHIY